jgi:hypothetical protein
MGLPPQGFGGAGGIRKLSELEIDTDKDWQGFRIRNIGAPLSDTDVPRARAEDILSGVFDVARIPDLSASKITTGVFSLDRIPTIPIEKISTQAQQKLMSNVPAVNIAGMTAVIPFGVRRWFYFGRIDPPFTGRAAFKLDTPILTNGYALCSINGSDIDVGFRIVDANNFYIALLYTGAAASDFRLAKHVGGTETILAQEAVDLSAGDHVLMCRAVGTTIEGWRGTGIWGDDITLKLSATDTSHSSGYGGGAGYNFSGFYRYCMVVEEASEPYPKPEVVGCYEVPVIGDGTPENPYRAQLPDVIEVLTGGELDSYDDYLRKAILENNMKVNRVSVSYSAIIPTDPATGRPLHKTCLVFVYDQPSRQPHLWKIRESLDVIEKIPEVIKHDEESAKRRALELDRKLKIEDVEKWKWKIPSI